jgi:hypothetical protein
MFHIIFKNFGNSLLVICPRSRPIPVLERSLRCVQMSCRDWFKQCGVSLSRDTSSCISIVSSQVTGASARFIYLRRESVCWPWPMIDVGIFSACHEHEAASSCIDNRWPESVVIITSRVTGRPIIIRGSLKAPIYNQP